MFFTGRRRTVILFFLISVLVIVELVPRVRGSVSPLLILSAKIERGFSVTVKNLRRPLGKLFLGTESFERLESLEDQVEILSVDRVRFTVLEAENEALKKTASFTVTSTVGKEVTRVIGHDPRDPQTLLRLGRGRNGGIFIGSAVVNPQGYLAGIIVGVGEVTSTMRLLRGSGVVIPVKVPGQENVFGLLESTDGLSLTIKQIPKNGKVQIGDVVVTGTGLDGVPPNLPVGTVSVVSEHPEGLWQEAVVSPLVQPQSIDIVSVLLTDYEKN